MTHRYPALVLALLTLVFTAPLRAQPGGVDIAPPPFGSSSGITSHEVQHHIDWLASDALEGRGTGSEGIARAGAYIAREFERYGLLPKGDDGSWYQEFEVITGVEAGDANTLVVRLGGVRHVVDGADFRPFGFSQAAAAQGTLVFAGYGIDEGEDGRRDFGDGIVGGSVALVLAGYPEDADPHGPMMSLARPRSKALSAREAGAAALIVLYPDSLWNGEVAYDRSPSDAGLPVVKLQARVLDSLMYGGGNLYADLCRAAATEGFRPTELAGLSAELQTDVRLTRSVGRNVIGLLQGTDAASARPSIVIGAHYDHLGWGGEGSLYRGSEPMIHNGADDNASGTAGMLELAQYFADHRPAHSILFMGFSAEEMGLLGSAYWVAHPTVPLATVSAMINLDMVGRLVDSTRALNVQGTGTSPSWKGMLERSNADYNFDLKMIEDGQGASDHSSFYGKDIPVLFFFTGLHTDYHRPSDDAHLVNAAGEADVLRFIADIVKQMDTATEKLAFNRVKVEKSSTASAFRVYVGTIPDYGNTGNGFRINGTSPGSPAEKAGLAEGDVIVRFGSTDVGNIYDYMTALSRHSAGEDVPVVVRRGDEHITISIHLESK